MGVGIEALEWFTTGKDYLGGTVIADLVYPTAEFLRFRLTAAAGADKSTVSAANGAYLSDAN